MDSIAGSAYTLPPCPSSPNCISSQAPDNRFIAPFPITGEARAAFSMLRDILAKRHDTTILPAKENMLRVEFKTALGFVDDGLFVLDTEAMVIHLRSASRAGYWDLGKNRSRMEQIRQEYLKRCPLPLAG